MTKKLKGYEMQKLIISFIIRAEKASLKKPDINEGIYVTFNMLHKPALLGILGAIIGLKGYLKNEEFPEYYNILKTLPVGIKPIGDEKGVFKKTVITYTNTTGFASEESGGILTISEQTLINPSYEVFLLLDLDSKYERKLYEYIREQKSEFLPYLGKNDYSLWWDKNKVKRYSFEEVKQIEESYRVGTIFKKDEFLLKDLKSKEEAFRFFDLLNSDRELEEEAFAYFERLPVDFNEQLYQYNYADFVYTTFKIKKDLVISNLYRLDNGEIVYLF